MASQQLAGNILAFFHCLTPLSSTMCGVVSGFGIEGRIMKFKVWIPKIIGWFKNPVSSQTEKLMAGTKFSDYLGLNHY